MNQLRKVILFLGIFSVIFLLTSCSYFNFNRVPPREFGKDLVNENWMRLLNINPFLWEKYAGSWYLTGEPLEMSSYVKQAPWRETMTEMNVHVPNFTNVMITGNYQVQIMGGEDANSVSIVGSNAALREAAVFVNDATNTLVISQVPKPTVPCQSVIIRIGIQDLNKLILKGGASAWGTNITSTHLAIAALGRSTVYMKGRINLIAAVATGVSNITMLGVIAPCVSVKATGASSIRLAGRIGIQKLINYGNGEVTIYGADSDGLDIQTAGGGITRVVGQVNLRKVNARGMSRVYVFYAQSKNVFVKVCDRATVAIAGCIGNLVVSVKDYGLFLGKNLLSQIAYVKTCNNAHANISAQIRFFGHARDDSTIYYFGSPETASRFTTQNGRILTLWNNTLSRPTFHFPFPADGPWLFKSERMKMYSTIYDTPYRLAITRTSIA